MLTAPLIEKDPNRQESGFAFDSGMNIMRSSRKLGERLEMAAKLKPICEIFDVFPVGDAAFEYGRVAEAFLPLLDPKTEIYVWGQPGKEFAESGEPVYFKLEKAVAYPHRTLFWETRSAVSGEDSELAENIIDAMYRGILDPCTVEKFQNPDAHENDEDWRKTLNVFANVKQRTGIDLLPRVTDLHVVAPANGVTTVEYFLAAEGVFLRQPENAERMRRAFDRDNISYPSMLAQSFFNPPPAPGDKYIGPHSTEVTAWVGMNEGFFITKNERFAFRLLRAIGIDPKIAVNNTVEQVIETPKSPVNPRGQAAVFSVGKLAAGS